MSNIKIKIENLNSFYGNKQVLKNINCNIIANNITCIIGASGCGKTTLLKTLNKSIEYDDVAKIYGKILLDNVDIDTINTESLRKKIGIVTQTAVIFPFSIYKNLLYPLDYHTKLSKSEKENRIINVLKKVKLFDEIKDSLNKAAENLSGGQKQRLSIARTLLTEPDVLLLDEPCSALDVKNQEAIENLLIELKKEITIVIVTHNIKEAKKIQDYTIFMNDGVIVEEGNNIFNVQESDLLKNFLN